MRQRPNVVPEIAYLVLDLTYGPAGFRRGRREVAIYHSQSYRQEREALIDVIVKFSRKPVTFLLVGYNPMAGDSVSPRKVNQQHIPDRHAVDWQPSR
jgi:hypothetical protein